jgi:thymidylate synthase
MKKIHPEYQYLNLLKDIMKNGQMKVSHSTGVKLKSVFGRMARFDLSQGFPLLTTKKVFFRGVIHELIWFLSGSPNIRYLIENDVHIWDDYPYKNYKLAMAAKKVPEMTFEDFFSKLKTNKKFCDKWGDIGPVYGVQWRRWPTGDGREIDQLGWAINKIKKYPQKKHYVISAWNAGSVYEMAKDRSQSMAIAPCHTMFHINITGDKLSLLLYQRSCDMFLGVPFNIASYALLTMLLAQVTGYQPGEFVHVYGDAHIYENHFVQVKEQLKRKPRPFPTLKLDPSIKSIDDFRFEHIKLENYNPYPPIKGKLTPVGGF